MSNFWANWLPNIVCGFFFWLLSTLVTRDTVLRWGIWFAHRISQLSVAGLKITVAPGPLSVGAQEPLVMFGGGYVTMKNWGAAYEAAWAVIHCKAASLDFRPPTMA